MASRYSSQLKPVSRNRIQQASRRATTLNSPAGIWNGMDVESFNFNTLSQLYFQGRRDRFQRYEAYDAMDSDADINRGLNIIAEHCTQKDPKSMTPFRINVENDMISHEDAEILFQIMTIWNRQCGWDNLTYTTVRNVLKYGDFFFIRDPETFKLFPTHPRNVNGIYVDEDTSDVQAYHFDGLRRRFSFMHEQTTDNSNSMYRKGQMSSMGQEDKIKTYSGIIMAENVVHLSMNEGIDIGANGSQGHLWPFGESIFEKFYKDYKARSLLEDAEVIHRIQRAPSRRVFYVDVGKQRGDRAQSYARKLKNELMQKRIPSRFGGQDVVESVYNPISQMEDLFLTVSADGRGTKVENLEGQTWSDEGPLKYFYNKMTKGMGIPNSYMAGPEDQGQTYNDGRVGTAYLQEFEFANMCIRYQDLLDNVFDDEFKLYLAFRGVHIDSGAFDVKFVEPMNFAEYREAELNETRLNLMASAMSIPQISKRFAMREFGKMTDDQLLENEHMFMEEQLGAIARQYDQENELGGMGVGLGGLNSEFGGDFGGGMGDEFGGDGMGGPGGPGNSPAGDMGGFGGQNNMAGGVPSGGPAGFESFTPKQKKIITEMMKTIQYGDRSKVSEVQKRLSEMVNELQKENTIRLTESELDMKPDDLVAVPKRAEEPTEVGDDMLFGKTNDDADQHTIPLIDLSYIRKLRLERERNRKQLVKRLYLMKTIYGPQPDAGGGMGF